MTIEWARIHFKAMFRRRRRILIKAALVRWSGGLPVV